MADGIQRITIPWLKGRVTDAVSFYSMYYSLYLNLYLTIIISEDYGTHNASPTVFNWPRIELSRGNSKISGEVMGSCPEERLNLS